MAQKIIWKTQFNSEIQSRGHQYYLDGRVMDLISKGTTYEAIIKGSGRSRYAVKAKLTKNVHPGRKTELKLDSSKCTCPYAQKGYLCKHMAALMYAVEQEIEDENRKEQEEAGYASDFPENDQYDDDIPDDYLDDQDMDQFYGPIGKSWRHQEEIQREIAEELTAFDAPDHVFTTEELGL